MHPLHDMRIYDLFLEFEAEPTEEIAWKIVQEFYNEISARDAEETVFLALTCVIHQDKNLMKLPERRAILWFYENFVFLNKAIHYLSTKIPEISFSKSA